MKPALRLVALAFALFGLAAASTSLYVHDQLTRQPGYTSFCDINALFSCTDAYLSRYGSLFGVPTALLGLLWFAGVVLFLALAARPSSPFAEASGSYLFVASTLALAWILYLAYAAFFILKAICILCLATYVAVVGLFVVSGIAASMPMTKLLRRSPADLRRLVSRPASLGIVVLFLAASGAAMAAFPRGGAAEATAGAAAGSGDQQASLADQQKFEQWYTSQPRVVVPVPAGGAAVLIVKFTDYQCPSCAQSLLGDKPVLARFESRYPGAVKLVSKNYPLETECNPGMPRDIHMAACEAAAAMVMARARGRAEALGEYFSTNQTLMSPFSVREAARTVGLVPDYDAQLPRAMEEVKADVGLGRLLGIRVTPTYFFNGVRIEGGLPPHYLETAITVELRRAGILK